MGGGQSVAIPGGGTEGYHVLRVSRIYWYILLSEYSPADSKNGLIWRCIALDLSIEPDRQNDRCI